MRRAMFVNRYSDSSSVSGYLMLSIAALLVSCFGWLAGGETTLRIAVVLSAAATANMVVFDALAVWRYGARIGRLTIFVGVLYWFWIEGLSLAFDTPSFPARSELYPFFWGQIPDDIVGLGLVAVNLFTLSSIISWQHVPIPQGILARMADRFDPASGSEIDIFCLAMGLIGIVPIYITFGGSESAAWETLSQMRAAEDFQGADPGLALHFQYFGIAGAAIAIARTFLRSPGNQPSRYLAIALTVTWVFFGASRFNLAFVLLPSIVLLMLPGKDKRIRNSRKKRLIGATAIVALTLLVQGAARTVGIGEFVEDQAGSDFSESITKGFIGHEHLSALMMALDLVPEKHDYFMEPMLPYFVTHFVPRIWWPDKSYPATWIYYNSIVTQGHAFNVTPSVIGQYYMGWGLFGVIYIGMFFGWMARFVDAWFGRITLNSQLLSATMAGLWLVFIFVSFRILYPLYFAFPMFAMIAYWIISRRLDPAKASRRVRG